MFAGELYISSCLLNLPEEKCSICMPVFEKRGAKECSNYRTFAPISHASKVMQQRLLFYMEQEMSAVKSWILKSKSTRYLTATVP